MLKSKGCTEFPLTDLFIYLCNKRLIDWLIVLCVGCRSNRVANFLSSHGLKLWLTFILVVGLKNLQAILLRYPGVVRQSQFVFVPGPMDIGITGILPRYRVRSLSPHSTSTVQTVHWFPSFFPRYLTIFFVHRPRLPKNLTKDFETAVKNATFTTNPCRIQFCTKEIVVIREDILTKMCRTLIKDPPSTVKENRFKQLTVNVRLHYPFYAVMSTFDRLIDWLTCFGICAVIEHDIRRLIDWFDSSVQLAKTILSQGHLCPLPSHVLPVHWSYDHALRLPALPDLIVTADLQEPFAETHSDCLVASPSSFPRHNFQFHVYWPSQNAIELSQI